MTSNLEFIAQEYNYDGIFQPSYYKLEGNEQGWIIYRKQNKQEQYKEFFKLPSGYTLIENQYCGICSTDLNRQYLPWKLPQVTGHEVVGFTSENKQVAIEINASHFARGINDSTCDYCCELQSSMHRQCPQRITLGINTLIGGFSPYLLAPVHSLIEIPEKLENRIAKVLAEPLAAALHGIETTPPSSLQKVAVVGPRKLGVLVIAALVGFRKQKNIEFEITAIAKYKDLLEICKNLGADHCVHISPTFSATPMYDIVFDTTGSPSGFLLSLQLVKKGGVLHLKSTSGKEQMGIHHFTQMVVDELSLLPFSHQNMEFSWPNEQRLNSNVYVSPSVPQQSIAHLMHLDQLKGIDRIYHILDVKDAFEKVKNLDHMSKSPFPRFDIAIISKLEELDRIIRPDPEIPISIVRARGTILILNSSSDLQNPLLKAIDKDGISIRSSRCGDILHSLQLLSDNSQLTDALENYVITSIIPLSQINKAFEIARNSNLALKVVIDCKK